MRAARSETPPSSTCFRLSSVAYPPVTLWMRPDRTPLTTLYVHPGGRGIVFRDGRALAIGRRRGGRPRRTCPPRSRAGPRTDFEPYRRVGPTAHAIRLGIWNLAGSIRSSRRWGRTPTFVAWTRAQVGDTRGPSNATEADADVAALQLYLAPHHWTDGREGQPPTSGHRLLLHQVQRTKCFMGMATTEKKCGGRVKMAEIVFGADVLEQHRDHRQC